MMALEDETKYDLIIWCRFDNCIRLKKNTNQCNPTKLILPDMREIDTNKLYISHWDHFHSGYSDHWFFSNEKIIQKIANMYDELYNYFQINSNFYKNIINLSKKHNNNGFAANSHAIHEFHIKLHEINFSDIKILRFNGN